MDLKRENPGVLGTEPRQKSDQFLCLFCEFVPNSLLRFSCGFAKFHPVRPSSFNREGIVVHGMLDVSTVRYGLHLFFMRG